MDERTRDMIIAASVLAILGVLVISSVRAIAAPVEFDGDAGLGDIQVREISRP